MKKVVVLCALVGVAVYAATAWSASGSTRSTDPTVQRLVKDVATLKKQVSTLNKQLKALNTQTAGAVDVLAVLGICTTELTADALQGTWAEIDQLAGAQTESPGKTYFGVQSPVTATVNGQDWCAQANVTRSQVLPPTVANYQALLAPFHSNALGTAALSVFGNSFHQR